MLRMDFTSQDYLRNPAMGLAELRAAGPVVEVRFPIIGKTWITTTSRSGRPRSEGQRDVHNAQERQSCRPALVDARVDTHARGQHADMDEPDHTRLRSIVDEVFRRRAILDMEPRIFAIADELAAELFADGSPADLVDRA